MTDIVELVLASRKGDEQAQERLVEAVQERVFFHCLRMLKNRDDAEDATQDILIAMLRGLNRLRKPEAFWGWLYHMIVNTCNHRLDWEKAERRRRQAAEPLLDEAEELDRQCQPEELLDNEENRRIIVELVDALPEAQRMCVLLYYYDELTVGEISAIMNIPEGTVKSRLNYARQAIKKGVDNYTRQGFKLYGLTPLPFIQYFLQQEAASTVVGSLAPAVLAAAGAAVTGGVAAAGAAVKAALGALSLKKAVAVAALLLAGALAGGILTAPAKAPEIPSVQEEPPAERGEALELLPRPSLVLPEISAEPLVQETPSLPEGEDSRPAPGPLAAVHPVVPPEPETVPELPEPETLPELPEPEAVPELPDRDVPGFLTTHTAVPEPESGNTPAILGDHSLSVRPETEPPVTLDPTPEPVPVQTPDIVPTPSLWPDTWFTPDLISDDTPEPEPEIILFEKDFIYSEDDTDTGVGYGYTDDFSRAWGDPLPSYSLEYVSSEPSIVQVNEQGQFSTLRPGSAVITATDPENPDTKYALTISVKRQFNWTVTLLNPKPLTVGDTDFFGLIGWKFDRAPGFSIEIKASNWVSSNSSVAAVVPPLYPFTCILEGKAPGTAEITGIVTFGVDTVCGRQTMEDKVSFEITVEEPPVEEPPVEEPSVEEPPVEESSGEETLVEELSAEDPTVEDSLARSSYPICS